MYGAQDIAESFRTVRRNTIQIAEDIPGDKFGFKAADGVKSVGEFPAHIAVSSGGRSTHQQRISSIEIAFFAGRAQRGAAEQALATKEQILEALKTGGEEFAWMVADDA
jgi:hypothetical protein